MVPWRGLVSSAAHWHMRFCQSSNCARDRILILSLSQELQRLLSLLPAIATTTMAMPTIEATTATIGVQSLTAATRTTWTSTVVTWTWTTTTERTGTQSVASILKDMIGHTETDVIFPFCNRDSLKSKYALHSWLFHQIFFQCCEIHFTYQIRGIIGASESWNLLDEQSGRSFCCAPGTIIFYISAVYMFIFPPSGRKVNR